MSSTPVVNPRPAGIGTPGLLLRPPEPADVTPSTRLWTDPEVRRFLGGPLGGRELDARRRHFVHRPHLFTVATREDTRVVGSVVIDPAPRFGNRREAPYGFLSEHWGRGYAREAVAAVVDWAPVNVPSDDPTVIAVTQEADIRSRRLLEAIGMCHVDSFVECEASRVRCSVGRQGLRVGR
ncbi:GNAT family N-acetyltransferase [Streptomyces angustmyceticus]|uniref:GNAT family N-acetyltransferase n=1 Tax=Streptomyces angustmyceticus TaxID=285578 RepID=UPI00344FBBE2